MLKLIHVSLPVFTTNFSYLFTSGFVPMHTTFYHADITTMRVCINMNGFNIENPKTTYILGTVVVGV